MDERANLLFYGIFRYFILSDSHHLLQRKALRINLRAFSLNRRDLGHMCVRSRLPARSVRGLRSTGAHSPHHLLFGKPRKFNVYEVFSMPKNWSESV